MDVVDDAGAEGGDGVVDEAEGDGDFVFFGAEGEGLRFVLMWWGYWRILGREADL